MRGPSRGLAAVAVCVCLAAAGCSGGGDGGPKSAKSPAGPSGAAPQVSGTRAKDGYCGTGDPCRIEMKQIERHGDRSAVRFYVTNLGKESTTVDISTVIMPDDVSFKLLDPVHHKGYTPLKDDQDHTIGSEPASSDPGVRYEAVLEFPAIPKDVRTLTVITPTTAGEFTSVPVVDSGGPIAPSGGKTTAWPMYKPEGKVDGGGVFDLYGHTEGTAKSTTTGGSEEKVELHTDVLFDFDKATLNAKAKAVLDDVAAETRAKADPAKPPILITGHTDGKGTHAYNMRLSQQRADAVLKELQARLGTGYQYKAEGKGETEPVAKEGGPDDAKARAKNRRVEISYKIKQRTATTTTTSATPTEQEKVSGGSGGSPAPFHKDGKTVASRTTSAGPTNMGGDVKRRIDVKPFYRDGDYLVAVFDIVNLGPGDLDAGGDYGPPAFGDFSVVDSSGTSYENVTYGPDKGANLNHGDPGRAVYRMGPNTANRGFFYVPAPPASVKTVTLDAGYFGKIPGIPIR